MQSEQAQEAMVTPDSDVKMSVQIELPESLWRRFRAAASLAGRTAKELAIEAFEEKLAKERSSV